MSNIRERMGISELNAMQRSTMQAAAEHSQLVLYSPTGTGKTLAFSVPLLKTLKNYPEERLQAVIIAPSRELAQQTYDVVRQLATGYKVTCTLGGRDYHDEKASLSVTPSIIVATPGRLLDHERRGRVDLRNVRLLVIDEFDKCLELGFEEEMKRLCHLMPNLSRFFLTSATRLGEIPEYLHITEPEMLDFLDKDDAPASRMTVTRVNSPEADKLETLRRTLIAAPRGKSIVFCNFRDAAQRIGEFLSAHRISAGVYHGGLEQLDREKNLALFNNGSFVVLVTTDLGARGLDINQVQNIIHYHKPVSQENYTHRNGRTARVDATGNIWVILGPNEQAEPYMHFDAEITPADVPDEPITAPMATIYFKAGKKEKISKGDIAGFISHQGGIEGKEVGVINVYDHYALAAIPAVKAKRALKLLSEAKLKGRKVRLSLAKPMMRPAEK